MIETANMTRAVIPHGAHWAIEEGAARQLWSLLMATDFEQHAAEYRAARAKAETEEPEKPYEVHAGVAVVPISGVLTKAPTSLDGGTSTAMTRRAIRAATRDKAVSGIMLVFDSPGGAVAGSADLAAEVKRAAQLMPVCSYIEDCCCSAAYWVASQASYVYANESAIVGSIGTYQVVVDSSKRAEDMGVKVHVIATGAHKGTGTPGAPINDEQLSDLQRTTNEVNEVFLKAVMSARGFDREAMDAIADGRVFVGAKAVELGLIDGIASFDAVFPAVRSMSSRRAEEPTVFLASAEDEDTNDLSSEEQLIRSTLDSDFSSALTAVSMVAKRMERIRVMRQREQRPYSPKRLEQGRALHQALGQLLEECEACPAQDDSCSEPAALIDDTRARSLLAEVLSSVDQPLL